MCLQNIIPILEIKKKGLEFLEKQHRALQKSGWESDEHLFKAVADGTSTLVKAYLEENTMESCYSAKMKVKGILQKSDEFCGTTEDFKLLKCLLQDIEINESSLNKG